MVDIPVGRGDGRTFDDLKGSEWGKVVDTIPMEYVPVVAAIRNGKTWGEACEAAGFKGSDRYRIRVELAEVCPKVVEMLDAEERRWLATDAADAIRGLLKSDRSADRDRAIRHARAICGMDAPTRSIISDDDEMMPLEE